MKKDSIILIGMAGTGKSTIGLRLAKALALDFIDLDEYIFHMDRKKIQSIIDDKGENALLLLEKQRMYELNMKHRVIAPGGSIIYHPDLMKYLKERSFLIYRDDTFENIKGRLKNTSTRGIVGFKSKSLREIYDERRPLYLQYADIIVNQEGKSKEIVIKEIIKHNLISCLGNNEKKAVGRNNWTIIDGLSQEDEILIHCARINLSPLRREALKSLLAKEPDWDLLLEKATFQRLSCLVSHHLRSADLSAFVPQLGRQKLQNIYYSSLARNMLLQNELSQLLSAFNREGIPVIVLKGAALLGSIYQDISLRPMSDIDILVHLEHLDNAEAIVSRQGYSHIHSRRSQKIARKKLRHMATMVNLEKHIILEIHQHIEDADSTYHFDLRSFWDRAQSVTILGSNTLTLAPEDLLIHLGLNFIRDRRDSSNSALGQLCDISEVILHFGDSLNWNLIERTSKEYGITPALHCVFYICQQLLGTQIPASILSNLQPLGFNPSIATLFINRRLLDTKEWLRLDWIAPKYKYSQYKALLAIINKIFHIPLRIYESRGQKKSYYFRLMKDMVPTLAQSLLKPMELKQDLLLDRWLHDIGSSTTQIQLNNSSSKSKSTGAQ